MKAGFTTSALLHAAILGFGLISLGAPEPLDAGATESLPVDIVPLEELTQIQEGDKTASLSETPAPKPTTKPQTVPDAKTAGDNDADLSTPETPTPAPREVKTASTPPPPPPTPKAEPPPEPPKPIEPPPPPAETAKPAPPAPKAETKPAVEPESAPEAEPIEAAEPEPKPEEKQPEPKPVEAAEAKPEETKLPDVAPSPMARPQEKPAEKPADAKVAEAKPAKKTADAKDAAEEESLEDQVAMLLNKQKPAGGGAKRSQTQKTSLGGKQTNANKLSRGEMDALSGQLGDMWKIPAGMENMEGMRVSIRFNVDAGGKLVGQPTVDVSSGNAAFDQSAVRAVQKANRDGLMLPSERAEDEYVVNFDPTEML